MPTDRCTRYKSEAKQKLTSPEGIQKRKRKATDVEPVFWHLKQNKGMKRYVLWGLHKEEIETALHVIAHNMYRKAAYKALWMGSQTHNTPLKVIGSGKVISLQF